MNIQTYQQCIQSLQKQIKSREQQRKQMEFTIQSLDKQLTDEIKKNKSLKEEVNYVMRNNQSLVMQLHAREQMIQSQRVQVKSAQTGDEFMRQKNLMLQKQKKNLEQELNQRDAIIKETNKRVRELQVQVKKNESLVEGYRNIVNEKARDVARLQTLARQSQMQKDTVGRELSKAREQFQAQKNELEFKIQHSQGTVEQTLSEFQTREAELLQQLSDLKELHTNQLSTMRFNYAQEIKQLQSQISTLQKDVLHYMQHIQQLKEHDKEVKRLFDAQSHNKDDVIKQLLNEINFLKTQKIEFDTKTQTKMQQLSQTIHKIQLQTTVHVQNTTKMEEQNIYKIELIQKLKIQIQILNQQTKHYQTLLEEEKDHSFKKGEQIFQLKSQIQKLCKNVQNLKKQKEFNSNNTSKELTLLRNKNIDLQRSLLSAQSQLQQQRIRIVELQQKIKELTYQRYSTTQNKSELIETIQNHQTTIKNLQNMLEQSKKLINQLNSMMKFKLQQIDTLEQSNTMFRTEKMEWLKNEEDYRRKIVQLRNVSWGNVVIRKNNTPNGDTSINTVRTTHRANTEFHKMPSQSNLSSPGGQNRFSFYSGSLAGGTPKHNTKRKTINPHNWHQRLHGYDQQDSINPQFPSSSSNDDFSISIPQIQEPPTFSNAYRQQSKNKKIRTSHSHEVDEEIFTKPMKKKEKRHQFVGENTQNKTGLRKDYSVGIIKAAIEKQQ